MATLFSVAFTGLFLAFAVAAILGHALLIEAAVRPFFVRLAAATQSTLSKNSLAPAR